uniref:CSON015430 protein n=1 Tax=Culicoides sonorensis TaxID=179676 RepID=A0A336LPP1_CULSO
MEALYHQTNKLVQEIQQLFQQLNNYVGDSSTIESDILKKIDEVNGNCEKLDVYVFKVPVGQRQNAKMRVDQLKYDVRHLQQKQQRRAQEANEREQLLSRRFSPNSVETSINLDFSLQQHNAMQNAHQGIDEMLYTGSNVLDNLRSQRDTLKTARTRILDIGNTLGLSNHTMMLIERRVKQDKWVMFYLKKNIFYIQLTMSINVTLHENKYQNERDPKFLKNFDFSKKQELEKRKRLRLEQVRQQSKLMAKNIRNKYEEEKKRQEKCLEECKAKELKLWQKKNIQKLQKDYEKCIKDCGSAQKAARKHENDENFSQAQLLNQRATAAKRGLLAAERLRKSRTPNTNKKTLSRLKQKSVSIQTEIESLSSTSSDLDTSKKIQNLSISSDENIQAKNSSAYVNPDKPYLNFKSNAYKTILSSSDDEEEIKILSDMTSEENDKKNVKPQETKCQKSIDYNYDQPTSEYKLGIVSESRPFTQVSKYLKKRQDSESEQRTVLAEVGNNCRSLDPPRTLLEKEKLEYLIKSSCKNVSSLRKSDVSKQLQPSVQRVVNAIRQPKLKPNSYKKIIDKTKYQEHLEKRPPEQIPSDIQMGIPNNKKQLERNINKLTKQLDVLSNEERLWKAYDTTHHDFSTDKLMKDAQSKQKRLENDFKSLLSRPAVVTCPKIDAPDSHKSSTFEVPTINVAELLIKESDLKSKMKYEESNNNEDDPGLEKNSEVQRSLIKGKMKKLELDRVVNLEMLKDLLEKINQQKQSLLYEIHKDGTIPDMTKYKEIIEKLEKQKIKLLEEKNLIELEEQAHQIETEEKARIVKENLNLENREKKLRHLEHRLENEMKKLYKNTVAKKSTKSDAIGKKKSFPIEISSKNFGSENIQIVQDESTSSSLEESSGECINRKRNVPVKIVIKVNECSQIKHYKKTGETGTLSNKKVVPEKIKDKPSKEYPKTPKKTQVLPEKENSDVSVIVVDNTSKIYTKKPHKESSRKKNEDRKSPEISGESGSTEYRDPPPVIKTEFSKFLDRITKETFEERHNKEKGEAKGEVKTSIKTTDSKNDKKALNPFLSHYIIRLLGMSRDSIDNLGMTSGSDIPTPNTSVIDVSNNISTSSSLEQVERLKKFVSENKNFIKEVNKTISQQNFNGTHNQNSKIVENVWNETLNKKEKEMAHHDKQKNIIKKTRVNRPCNQPLKPILKKGVKENPLKITPPPIRTLRLCSNLIRRSTISSTLRSKSVSPRKNKQFNTKQIENNGLNKNRRTRSVSPERRTSESSNSSPSKIKSILKSPRKLLTSNINDIIDEVELLRVAGKHEDKILDKYAELTENCSKRINELAQMIEMARVDKKLVLESSMTSTEQPNSTEYMDLPSRINQNNFDDRTSPDTLSYQEENMLHKPTMKQMQNIGKSRDSGISMSRPVTSSDFRASTENVVLEETSDFVPILKDIPKVKQTDKLQHNSAEKLQEELQKFGSYIQDLDNSMAKLTKGLHQKQKSKPPTSIAKYTIAQIPIPDQPHELSTIIEAETSTISKQNKSTEKPVIRLSERSVELKAEDFPNFDEYLKARVEQFTQDSVITTDYVKKLLQSSTNIQELEYDKFPSIFEDLPSSFLDHMQKSADALKEDVFGDIFSELKRRSIIDKSVVEKITTNGTSLLSSVFETRVIQKTPVKKSDQSELDDTEPKTPTKPKTVHKKRSPKKRKGEQKNQDDTNLSGFGPLQKSTNEKYLHLETEMTNLGINWAASTLRRSQKAQALSSSSSSNDQVSKMDSTQNETKNPQKPIGLREFLTRELMLKSHHSNSSSSETSLSSQFLKSLMNISGIPSSSSSGNFKDTNDIGSAVFKRTSTPLQERSATVATSSKSSSRDNSIAPTTQLLHFSGESRISSVKSDRSDMNEKNSTLISKETDMPPGPPNIVDAEKYASSSSKSE